MSDVGNGTAVVALNNLYALNDAERQWNGVFGTVLVLRI